MSTCPCDYLEKQYKFERENRVVFDDSLDESTGERLHDYYIDGNKDDIVSVTTLIHRQFSHFDAEKVVNKIIRNRKHRTDPDYKYYLQTKETILADWEANRVDASSRGTELHLHIEQFYNKYPFTDDTQEFQHFLQFDKDYKHLTAFRTEMVVFDEYHRLCGSIDMLFKDPDGNLWIYDWKRSKEFKFENSWQSGLDPISHLDDCNINHYTMQLNLYKYILEKHYNQTVAGMCLVRFHPNLNGYERVPVTNRQEEIGKILEEREKELYPEKFNTDICDEQSSNSNLLVEPYEFTEF